MRELLSHVRDEKWQTRKTKCGHSRSHYVQEGTSVLQYIFVHYVFCTVVAAVVVVVFPLLCLKIRFSDA